MQDQYHIHLLCNFPGSIWASDVQAYPITVPRLEPAERHWNSRLHFELFHSICAKLWVDIFSYKKEDNVRGANHSPRWIDHLDQWIKRFDQHFPSI